MQTLRVLLTTACVTFVVSFFLGVFISAPAFSQGLPACPPLQVSGVSSLSGHGAAVPGTHPTVRGEEPARLHGNSFIELANNAPVGLHYVLKPGLLRPQVEALLREYLQIQVVIWQVHDSHFWPTDFRLTAASLDGLLEALLQPYGMGIRLYANHTAEIFYLPAADASSFRGQSGRERGQ
ncbi:hypothetical protein [Aliidiomarina haloalkalitolerans]|uniref:Uncharacterized protein n=1 Tax=Aliidiomarina haloalkalitolerans TaxID=859059 RepID=A0A432VQS6_9GAMM|nr:hypothetical protein [Aliidiomarina haloalkalitolerans]RUO18624.1 hypothetical protein CWE06_10295 [Aliidiomarina haloalkalitolerans]